jgi:hypothetical protein
VLAVAPDAVASVGAHEVITRAAGDPVDSAAADVHEVVAGTRRHDVTAAAGADPVAAAATEERVRARTPAKAVAARVAGEQVAPAQADEQVIPAAAGQAVVAGGALKPIGAGASGALDGERNAGRETNGKRDQDRGEEAAHGGDMMTRSAAPRNDLS